jgi:ATP-dependent DNA helicase RecG
VADVPKNQKRTRKQSPDNQKNATKQPENNQNILNILRKTPSIGRKEIAAALKITTTRVQSQLKILKKNGTIRRIGPDKGGYWEIVDI